MSTRIVPPTAANIRAAAEVIRRGGLVAFPTETVYGLGADALSADAAAKIYAAKGRPQDNPLIVHISCIADAERYAHVTPLADALMRHFWPGPLTVVLPARDIVPSATRAGLSTVALRLPMSAPALELIRASGRPLAGPSANRSGRPSPTTAQTVVDDIGDAVDVVIDGGDTFVGVESTVVDVSGDRAIVLRHGGITLEMLRSVVPADECASDEQKRRSPGTRHRHYAPSVPVVLWSGGELPVQGAWTYVGMSGPPEGASREIRFDDEADYARGLFSALRELESHGGTIVAELPSGEGIGRALLDRLRRAAGVE